MARSKIEWTDAVWNPVFGCSKISEGCRNCYAETYAKRLAAMGQAKYMHVTTDGRWNGNMSASDEVIFAPLNWKRPRRVFVNSMSDLFHENLSLGSGYHQKIFEVMLACPQHTFQILTKRPRRMRVFLNLHKPWRKAVEEGRANHIWIGTSVENQKAADDRIPHLQKTKAAVRFLSCEPLLAAIDLRAYLRTPVGTDLFDGLPGRCLKCGYIAVGNDWSQVGVKCRHYDLVEDRQPISWVIAGGESGPNSRPMHPNWVREMRDQCQAAGVPFFFKQWGEWQPTTLDFQDPVVYDDCDGRKFIRVNMAGGQGFHGEDPVVMKRVGKGKAGRLLDGRIWDEYPEVQA